ncbi:putative TetR family transcriptional regulator [Gordonia effusa NBRC 100432]|uniref:Putative TetR family transcriptional regulator n=1 Tax=Gordonia effusa NBRC 100432 TaxID=1077974 RepID=H0QUI2_9ACTN|nr:TetR/AcrR family transcriptional regulator [Gordonia effusa]GAB16483.1 putative TetR family transcriptional regulator [Gordonia effusa NBRC 100432]
MANHELRAARREAVLRSGAELLREGGLGALQMREVARRADVALGTLYSCFSTKEALFAALYARRLDQMFTVVEEEFNTVTDPRVLFIQFATLYRGLYAEFGREVDLGNLITSDNTFDPDTLQSLIRGTSRSVAAMHRILASLHVDQPDAAVVALWSITSGLAAHFTGPRSAFHQVGWDEAVSYTAEIVVNTLHTREGINHDK